MIGFVLGCQIIALPPRAFFTFPHRQKVQGQNIDDAEKILPNAAVSDVSIPSFDNREPVAPRSDVESAARAFSSFFMAREMAPSHGYS
ncbi:MAG: hypothetical protein ACOWWM_04960 [Desulfobacterales bacterium]